jgi:hypothetical protein
MTPRTNLITASQVDLALLLLPDVGWLATSCTLAASGVPLDVAVRVMALPLARRPCSIPSFMVSQAAI